MGVSATFAHHLATLSGASDAMWLAGMATGLVLTLVAAFAPLPAGGGKMRAYLGLFVRAALYAPAGDTLPQRGGATLAALFRLGIVAGLFELLVDWWLVNGIRNGRLDYLGARRRAARFTDLDATRVGVRHRRARLSCAVQLFGLLRRRLGDRAGAIVAAVAIAAFAGVTIGFYEYFAYRAGWWKYGFANVMIGSFCALLVSAARIRTHP